MTVAKFITIGCRLRIWRPVVCLISISVVVGADETWWG